MRGSANRQTVSSTARWNLAQSDPSSAGAQKRPIKNQQTGKGSNLVQLQRSLAAAELHLEQTCDPRTIQNITHGITLLKAQIARISGVDSSGFDIHTIPEGVTGYEFPGFIEAGELEGTAIAHDPVEQSILSPFATFQLAGTLRQKIQLVKPSASITPGGSLKHPGVDPLNRSNVIKTVNNPNGSGFPTGDPSVPTSGFHPQKDTRDQDYRGRMYMQGFTPGTHDNVYKGRGVVTSQQFARGKHGQYAGGYVFNGEGQSEFVSRPPSNT